MADTIEKTLLWRIQAVDEASAVMAKAGKSLRGGGGGPDDQAKIAQDTQKRTTAVMAEARESELRAQGRFLEAEVSQLKRSLVAQNEAVDESLKQRLVAIQKAHNAGAYLGGEGSSLEAAGNARAEAFRQAEEAKQANTLRAEAAQREATSREAQRLQSIAMQQNQGGTLDELKGTFGRGSTFTQVAKALGGAGPILGLEIAGRELDEITKKVVDIHTKWREGQLDQVGLTIELGKSVPILGNIVGAWENIKELATGERYALEQLNEENQRTNNILDAREQSLDRIRLHELQHADEVEHLNSEIRHVGLSGRALTYAQNEDRIKELQAKIELAKPKPLTQGQDISELPPELQPAYRGIVEKHQKDIDEIMAKAQKVEEEGKVKVGNVHVVSVEDTNAKIEDLQRQYNDVMKDIWREERDVRKGFLQSAHLDIEKIQGTNRQEQTDFERERLADVWKHEAAIRDIRVQAEAERLQRTGQTHAAELLLLQNSLRNEEREIKASAEERLRIIELNAKSHLITPEQANTEKRRVGDEAKEEKAARKKKYRESRATSDLQDARHQFDIESEIGRIRLAGFGSDNEARANGLSLEKQNQAITNEYAARKHEIDELERGAGKERKEQLEVERAKLFVLEKEDRSIAAMNNRISEETQLIGNRAISLEILKAENVAGDKSNELAERRLQISREFLAIQAEIQKKMESAKPEELPGLQKNLNSLPAAEERAQKSAADLILKSSLESGLQVLAKDSRSVRVALEQAKVHDTFTQQRHELSAILNDKKATSEQHDIAKMRLAQLNAEEDRADRDIAREGLQFPAFAQVQSSGVQPGSGGALALKAQADAFLRNNGDTDKNFQKRSLEQADAMITLLGTISARLAIEPKGVFDQQ